MTRTKSILTGAILAAAAVSATVMGCGLTSVDRSPDGSDGGGTGAPMCVDPKTDCSPPANECVTAVCDGAGLCAVKNADNGTAVATQTPGDCKKVVCDGAGKTKSSDDNTDVSDDGLECTTDTCAAGVPVHTPIAVNTACGMAGRSLKCDGAGACVGCVTVADCGMPAACKVNTCTAGACGVANAADATVCDDGDKCTTIDSCKTGVCTGATPVVCGASDQCHGVGTCDKLTGKCSNPVTGDGTLCNDGNGCTTADTCQVGICTGASPVVCVAMDQCHTAGTCTQATGVCSNPAKANGASCSDSNACTQTDTCQAGACIGANPVTCGAPDQCHTIGTCDTANGACSNPAKANGTSCSDSNACTQMDTCQAGGCIGANSVTCGAPDQCHNVGTCDTMSGACSNPAVPNGTICMNGPMSGSCLKGICQ